MNACGVIVEYNPFHNGHLHHIEAARVTSQADCIIAMMSGPFLQRGEPAIIDKFARAKAALSSGADIVIELPYLYTVQNSDMFAHGAVKGLHEIGVSSICFGSESGNIEGFKQNYDIIQNNKTKYDAILTEKLNEGISFPEASKHAYKAVGVVTEVDLAKPNNILGFSYVKAIYDQKLAIEPLTIKRKNNQFHDTAISGEIASATSIRKQLLSKQTITEAVHHTIPKETIEALNAYKQEAGQWHDWELYFPFLHYRVMTMSEAELAEIHGVDEGIEYRIKKTAKEAGSMYDWIERIKTKRYTWTRIQRMFVHILTNTKKEQIEWLKNEEMLPYLRILGFTKRGQAFLNAKKKEQQVELIFSLKRSTTPLLQADERAARAYYSVLPAANKNRLFRQEFMPPIQI